MIKINGFSLIKAENPSMQPIKNECQIFFFSPFTQINNNNVRPNNPNNVNTSVTNNLGFTLAIIDDNTIAFLCFINTTNAIERPTNRFWNNFPKI